MRISDWSADVCSSDLPFDLGHRSEIDYSGASHLVRDDRTCGLMEIAPRIVDMIDGGEVGDAAISLLDHIIDVDDMAPTACQPFADSDLVRNNFPSTPGNHVDVLETGKASCREKVLSEV